MPVDGAAEAGLLPARRCASRSPYGRGRVRRDSADHRAARPRDGHGARRVLRRLRLRVLRRASRRAGRVGDRSPRRRRRSAAELGDRPLDDRRSRPARVREVAARASGRRGGMGERAAKGRASARGRSLRVLGRAPRGDRRARSAQPPARRLSARRSVSASLRADPFPRRRGGPRDRERRHRVCPRRRQSEDARPLRARVQPRFEAASRDAGRRGAEQQARDRADRRDRPRSVRAVAPSGRGAAPPEP